MTEKKKSREELLKEEKTKQLLEEFKPIYDYFICDLFDIFGYKIFRNRLNLEQVFIRFSADEDPSQCRLSQRADESFFIQFSLGKNGHIEFSEDGIFKIHIISNGNDLTLSIKDIDTSKPREKSMDPTKRLNCGSANIEINIKKSNEEEDEEEKRRLRGESVIPACGFQKRKDEDADTYKEARIVLTRKTGVTFSLFNNHNNNCRNFRYKIVNGMIVEYEEISNEGISTVSFHCDDEADLTYKPDVSNPNERVVVSIADCNKALVEQAMIASTRPMNTISFALNKVEDTKHGLNQLLASLSPTFHFLLSTVTMQPRTDTVSKGIEKVLNDSSFPICDMPKEATDRASRAINIPF